jgi:hypothetical protein
MEEKTEVKNVVREHDVSADFMLKFIGVATNHINQVGPSQDPDVMDLTKEVVKMGTLSAKILNRVLEKKF